MTVGKDDFWLDLLFFSRPLRRLVAVELRLGKFKPAHKAQIELYLRWLDLYERQEGEDARSGSSCAPRPTATGSRWSLCRSGIDLDQHPGREAHIHRGADRIGPSRYRCIDILHRREVGGRGG